VEGAVDAGGKLGLEGLIALLGSVDAVVASSTGPLHLAAALGTSCVGVFGAEAPVWPERWRPIGPQADWIAVTEEAPEGGLAIPVDAVVDRLLQLRRKIP
jgi:ADP-heptose:LPS heptosyltransferase